MANYLFKMSWISLRSTQKPVWNYVEWKRGGIRMGETRTKAGNVAECEML